MREVTSKGVDVDIAADLADNWVLTLTYAYNDTSDHERQWLTAADQLAAERALRQCTEE